MPAPWLSCTAAGSKCALAAITCPGDGCASSPGLADVPADVPGTSVVEAGSVGPRFRPLRGLDDAHWFSAGRPFARRLPAGVRAPAILTFAAMYEMKIYTYANVPARGETKPKKTLTLLQRY